MQLVDILREDGQLAIVSQFDLLFQIGQRVVCRVRLFREDNVTSVGVELPDERRIAGECLRSGQRLWSGWFSGGLYSISVGGPIR